MDRKENKTDREKQDSKIKDLPTPKVTDKHADNVRGGLSREDRNLDAAE
jgi:hypothetical protein